jgi:hypothetical protein
MLCIGLPLCAAPAYADMPAAVNFKGIYEFSAASIIFGEFGIEAEQTPQHYNVITDVISTGLLKLFLNHTSHTVASGAGKDFAYPQHEYASHYQTKKKLKSAYMLYENSALVKHEIQPPEDPSKRTPVSAELKNSAADPLTLLLRMREQVFRKKENFSINVFDGRRMTQANFVLRGKQNLLIGDQTIAVIAVDVSRKPLAGFTQSEMADLSANEPVLHMYFSDDAKLIPVRLEVTTWLGTLSATLVKECRTGESCLFGIKD